MKIKGILFAAALLASFSCDNMLDTGILSNEGQACDNLSISVLTTPPTKDLITSSYLPSTSKIGVFVTNSTGGDYDGHSYNNIQFTAEGADANQKWTGASTVELSMNEGNCYAYYPYSTSVSDVTQIPVSTAGQVDYMYATPVTVNAGKKEASLKMKHALSAVRFMIKKGSYTGAGQVTAVSVQSSALGTSGTLNAKTGEVAGVSGTGSEISVSKSLTLSDVTQDVDVIVVPTGSAADLTLSVTIDGKTYSTVVSGATLTKANCNQYTLTVNQGELALSGIEIGDWGYDDSGAPTITAGSYKVTFAGNYSKFAFKNSVSDGTVTIRAYNVESSSMIRPVTISSGATLEQTTNENLRTITLSNITANITITFDGTALTWPENGVYVVLSDGTPVDPIYANASCKGVALSNSATNQRLMIEKYENANNTESTYVYKTAAQKLNSSYTYLFSWGGYGSKSGTFISWTVGAGSNSTSDYLYLDGSRLNIDPSTWAASGGALSDFAGRSNSSIIKDILDNGTLTSCTTAPMAHLMNAFNEASCSSTVNQGYKDWYIPSCGQLGLIWLNKTELDNALTAIGGTALSAATYWSSSESGSNVGWSVNLSIGRILDDYKNYHTHVRLVRDLF